ncbi:MAG TPA: PQQ-binding-like beta-propeller repeat protein [Actinomycetota bacterium]|jgi:hypothetical protein
MRSFVRVATAVMTVAVLAVGAVVGGTRLFDTARPKPAGDHSIGPWTDELYVLDPTNRYPGLEAAVYALDETSRPELLQRRSAGRYRAGYDPQLTLSPDGSRAYVMSTLQADSIQNRQNVIDTYDTGTGERHARATLPELDGTNKNRTLHKPPIYAPDFVSSFDGARLYLGESTIRRGPVRSKALVGTFDTETNSLLPNSIDLPDCTRMVLLPRGENALSVVCSFTATPGRASTVPTTNFVYFLQVDGDGSAASFERLDLPRAGVSDEEIAWASASSDGGTIYAVTRAGHVYVVDAVTQELRTEVDLEPRVKVQTQKVALSSDGSTLYVGTAPLGSSSIVDANGIAAYDVRTWDQIASVRAEDFFWTMTLGPGGRRIYAPSFDEPSWSIQVFDARSLEQLGTVGDVGRTPVLAEVPRLGR